MFTPYSPKDQPGMSGVRDKTKQTGTFFELVCVCMWVFMLVCLSVCQQNPAWSSVCTSCLRQEVTDEVFCPDSFIISPHYWGTSRARPTERDERSSRPLWQGTFWWAQITRSSWLWNPTIPHFPVFVLYVCVWVFVCASVSLSFSLGLRLSICQFVSLSVCLDVCLLVLFRSSVGPCVLLSRSPFIIRLNVCVFDSVCGFSSLSVRMHLCLPVCHPEPICLYFYPSVCLFWSVCLSESICYCRSVCLSVSMSVFRSLGLYFRPYPWLSVCLSACLSVCLPLCCQSFRAYGVCLSFCRSFCESVSQTAPVRTRSLQASAARQGSDPSTSDLLPGGSGTWEVDTKMALKLKIKALVMREQRPSDPVLYR